MQRMKQIALGAFSMAIATTGLASAGGDHAQDPATQSSNPGGQHAQPAPQTGSAATDSSMIRSMDAASSSAPGSMGKGMNRMQIEEMQRELAQRGLYQGAIDGMAGPQTMAALRQFQEQQGLPIHHGFDDATRQALGIQLDRQPVSGAQASSGPELERPVGREGATPSVTGSQPMRSQVQLDTLNQQQITTLQTRLQEFGFYRGQVDGVLGEGTRSALRQFYQTQADLASRGIITDATVGVFGVSPQGLNGTPSTTSPQRGMQPRGTDPRGAAPHSNMSPGMNPSGSSSTTGTLRNNNGIDEMNSASPSGTPNAPTRSTPPAPSGPSGTTPR